IGQGQRVWREWSCVAENGGLPGYSKDGPDAGAWRSLIEAAGWGYQPPVWPQCPAVIEQCDGRPGQTIITDWRAGGETPPAPDGSTWARQKWATRVTINC